MVTASLQERVIRLLTERHGIDRKKLEGVMALSKRRGRNAVRALVEEGLIGRQELLATLARGLGIPALQLSRYQPDPALAALVPERIARKHRVVPISRIGRQLSVAMADPMDLLALDDVALMTACEIVPLLAAEEEIDGAIEALYARSAADLPVADSPPAASRVGEASGPDEEVFDLSPFGMAGLKAPIVKVADLMLTDALRARASDIHVEPYEDHLRVRYRIDGALAEAFRLSRRYQNALVTRLKIMSRLDITENRLPQDGRFKARMEGREVDFRVSVLPVRHGNKVVLRVLDRTQLVAGLEELGFLPESLKAFQKALARPYGMILVTGPTGSGKSTTLYSALSEMNEPGRNILTVEDPVEYQLEGITQVQVRPEIGFGFAEALRAFLRQAPDVVLVGEIRDGETADIAVKAALTGQIVLSTLHTNDAPSALFRLLDMGVDPFLLVSSLVFVAAQRLCRRLCPRCKAPDPEGETRLKELGEKLPKGKQLFRAKGCPHCRKSGFRGRFAILEAMLLDDPIREMLLARKSPDQVKAHLQARGMRTLRQEGLVHCLAGRTSLDEVLRVTSDE